jgi:hypothetical protein
VRAGERTKERMTTGRRKGEERDRGGREARGVEWEEGGWITRKERGAQKK